MGTGKSTFAFSNTSIIQDGGSTTIGITRDNQSYYHKLRHGYGQFAYLPVGDTSHVWSPKASNLVKFWNEVPTQKTRSVDVTLDTYYDRPVQLKPTEYVYVQTLVGSDTHALTVTLSEETGKPTFESDFDVTDDNSTTNDWGVIIPGKSDLTESHTAEPKYGAEIASTTYCYGTSEHGSLDALVASLPTTETATDFEIGCKVKDTRGFTNTSTVTKKVVAYKAPTIDTFEIVRCDDAGKENESGTKAKVTVKGSWSPVNVDSTCKNPATFKIGYKTRTDESYTNIDISVSDGTIDLSEILTQTFDVDTDYYFSVSLADTFETYSQDDMPFSNSQSILYVSADGSEIVFGPETGSNLHLSGDSIDIRQGTSTVASFSASKTTDEDDPGCTIYEGDISVDEGSSVNIKTRKYEGDDSKYDNSTLSLSSWGNCEMFSSRENPHLLPGSKYHGQAVVKTNPCKDRAGAARVDITSDYWRDDENATEEQSANARISVSASRVPDSGGDTSNDTCRSSIDLSADTVDVNGDFTVHNDDGESRIKTENAAGDVYLYCHASDTGNRGLYSHNPGGTGQAIIYATADNKIGIAGGTSPIVRTTHSFTASAVSGGSYSNFDKTFTKSGYYPVGIVGIRNTNNNAGVYTRWYISSASNGSCTVTLTKRSFSSAISSGTDTIDILWIRSGLA